jgi:4-alpha-glucanotransferase
MKRTCGVLLHITSLPSPYGIGTFGKAAEEFVDFLRDSGQKYWQVLPLGPVGYGNSPYRRLRANRF